MCEARPDAANCHKTSDPGWRAVRTDRCAKRGALSGANAGKFHSAIPTEAYLSRRWSFVLIRACSAIPTASARTFTGVHLERKLMMASRSDLDSTLSVTSVQKLRKLVHRLKVRTNYIRIECIIGDSMALLCLPLQLDAYSQPQGFNLPFFFSEKKIRLSMLLFMPTVCADLQTYR